MKNIIIGVLAGVMVSLVGFIAYDKTSGNTQTSKISQKEVLPTYSTDYNAKANPHLDMEKASVKAKNKDKRILMIVGDNACPWSGEFDRFIEDNKEINDNLYSNYEVLKVYYNKKSKNNDIQSLLKQFPKGAGTPHFYVLDADKKLLKSQKSVVLEQGFSYSLPKVKDFLLKWKNP